MKRFRGLLILLCLAAFVTLFSACGDLGGGENNPAAPTPVEKTTYTVTYSTAYGTVPSETVEAGKSVEMPSFLNIAGRPQHLGFGGWYENDDFSGSKVTFPYTPTANVTLYLQYVVKDGYYKYTYNLNGGNAGAVYKEFMNAAMHNSFINNPPTNISGNIYREFLGWYDNSDFEGDALTAVPERDTDFHAKWGEAQVAYTTEGTPDVKYIYMGSAPCTIAPIEVRTALAEGISAGTILADTDGYYPYNGKRYAAKTAPTDNTDFYKKTKKFSDGTVITVGETYYFEVEPIKWRVISLEYGRYFLVSEYLYDRTIFDDRLSYSSEDKWDTSNIMEWLNDGYYNGVFSDVQQKFFVTPTGVATVGLLSYSETEALGGDNDRKAVICDWGRLERYLYTIAGISTDSDGKVWYGDYWTRTKDAEGVSDDYEFVYPANVYYCDTNGILNHRQTGQYAYCYARPCIYVSN